MTGIAAIQAAFESAIALMSAQLPTVWENLDFKPTAGTAYQAVYLLPAAPFNWEIGGAYEQTGILQVNLFFLQGDGWEDSTAQAEAFRSAFPRGLTLTQDGVKILITHTPEIGPGRAEDDLYFTPVKVRWSAQFPGG